MARAAGDGRNYRIAILDTKDKVVEELEGFPSVTTIIGACDGSKSDALMGWTYNVTAAAVADLLEAGVITPGMTAKTVQARIKSRKRAYWNARDESAARGTYIHDWAERLVLDKTTYDDLLEDCPPEWRGYADALIAWHRDYYGTPVGVERTLVHLGERYAGTADLIDQVEDSSHPLGYRTRVVDYKTSKRIYPSQLVQGDAYALAWEDMARRRGVPMPVDEVVVVRFGDDGKYEEVSRPPDGGKVFIKMLELYRVKEEG